MPKIRHGLSSCYYSTGGTPAAMPGAVEITLNGYYDTDISGTLNVPSMLSHVENLGYTGKLRLMGVPRQFCVDVFGWEVRSGVLIEKHTSGVPVQFRLLWQVKGTRERFALYECFALKPDISAKTDEKGATVSIAEIPLYAYYDDNGDIMANANPGEGNYNTWFE